MKILIPSKKQSRHGGALIITVLIFTFVALFLASYLLLTQAESSSVYRSQSWNNSLSLAEAGVEDALALINKNVGVGGGVTNWNVGAVSIDKWTLVSANVYSMTRWLGTGQNSTNLGYYTVYVTNTVSSSNTGPTILSIGYGAWNLSASNQPVRKILVYTKRDSLIKGNLAAISTVDFSGNNVVIDSFDSGDPYHSSWQTYMTYKGTNFYGFYPTNPIGLSVSAPDYATEPFWRKDNGYVTTDGNVINVGNGSVYGNVDTAPGGNVNVLANGSVGDVNWVPKAGIEPGHAYSDMNVVFPDVVLPTNNFTTLSKLNGNNALTYGNTNNGVFTFNYVITNTGYYQIGDSATPAAYPIYVKGTNVVLYLPGGLNFKGNNGVIWVETNSDVTIYSNGNVDTTGNPQAGINNISQYAPAFAIYGMPGCTSIQFGGQPTITAYVYAPEAALALTGGGSGYYHAVGAFFVKTVKLTGNMGFHYDEALKLVGPSRGFIPCSWQEVQ